MSAPEPLPTTTHGRRRWPLALAAREGLATARTGRWTSLLVIVTVAWAVAAPGVADALAVSDLLRSERAWIDAGGRVLVVTGARASGAALPIPAQACEALAGLDGVEATFALRRTAGTGSVAQVPGGRATIDEVSPGALVFLGAVPSPRGVVLATAGFAARTGVADGDPVTVLRTSSQPGLPAAGTTSDPRTLRVADTTSMGEDVDGALLVPALLTGPADACYVRTDAARHDAVVAVLPALLAHDGRPAVPHPRLVESRFTTDYSTAFQDRPLRWLWVPAAALLGLLWAMLQWFRRTHVAIYATFGMPPASRLVMQVSEWTVLAAVGGLVGWAIGVVGALALGARSAPALTLTSAHAALTLLTASVLVVLLGLRPTGTLLHALKDR